MKVKEKVPKQAAFEHKEDKNPEYKRNTQLQYTQ